MESWGCGGEGERGRGSWELREFRGPRGFRCSGGREPKGWGPGAHLRNEELQRSRGRDRWRVGSEGAGSRELRGPWLVSDTESSCGGG